MPKKATKPTSKRSAPPKKPASKQGGSETQTKYRPEYDAIVRNLVQIRGCNISEIAEILGKSVVTIYNWQAKYASFREALTIPLDIANKRVDISLYGEATGYYVEEEEIKIINGKIKRLKKKVWVRPSTTAIIWWGKVKAGYSPSDQPDQSLQGNSLTIDQNGQHETDRQIARRLAFLLNKGDKERETT